MSTRSLIGRANADGTITYIYCHYDGYPSGVGAMLATHWTDPAKVDALIELGDISVLGEVIGEKQEFDRMFLSDEERARTATWTLAYGRDRGEDGVAAETIRSVEAFWLQSGSGAQYKYLFKDGGWHLVAKRGELVSLDEEKEASKCA